MAKVIIPFLNPLNFVEVNPNRIPQYVSRFMDDVLWYERLTVPQNQAQNYWLQKWQNSDIITLQFQNNAGQIGISIVNCEGATVLSFIMTQKQQNQYQPDYFIYESNTSLEPLPRGRYMAIGTVGTNPVNKRLVSEPFYVQEEHPGTLLFEYVHRQFYGNMIFETGIKPSLRLSAELIMQDPVSKDTLYEDQVLDMVMIKSKPYRLLNLVIKQIPDWMANLLVWVLGCSGLRIDGRYYTKNEDAKLVSSVPAFFGALKDYSIVVRESTLQDSKEFDTDLTTDDEFTIQLNVESKGFADTSEDASSSIVSFIDVD